MNALLINHDGVFDVDSADVPDGLMPESTSQEDRDAVAADVLTSLTRKENKVGGSITYRDGRKYWKWFIGYEYVDVPTTFEPLLKMRKRSWVIG